MLGDPPENPHILVVMVAIKVSSSFHRSVVVVVCGGGQVVCVWSPNMPAAL